MHDFILVYGKSKERVALKPWERTDEQKAAYRNPDNDPRGVWRAQDLSASKPYSAGLFEITGPTGSKFSPPPNRYWRCNEAQFREWDADNRIWWGINRDARPMLKAFLSQASSGITPNTWWTYEFAGHNKEATLELKELFDGTAPFDTPKPVKLLKRIIDLAGDQEGLIMDFFCGSGTLGQAVLESNASAGCRNHFILVQLGEKISQDSSGGVSAEIDTIADIAKERLRRTAKRIMPGEQQLSIKDLDLGFRVLKIDSSNMKDVYYAPDAVTQAGLFDQVDNIKPDRTAEDLLFQVLLDWGVDLSLPIRAETLAGRQVFFVDTDALAACFETGVDEPLVRAIAERKPLRAVFRDAGFSDDSMKINVEQIFKTLSPGTEVKAI
jgi:adenine-specific DNA-methyltransferase